MAARTIGEIMTSDVRACPQDASAAEAARLMRDHGIGDVIVTGGDDDVPSGIVTDRDLAVRVMGGGRDPDTITLQEIMTTELVTVQRQTEVSDAVTIVHRSSVRRLPVVEDGEVLGIVTIGDLARERDPDSALADLSAESPNN
ncbi:CBS domain-containing protein [Egibacter rhizosphaerae]|uniref:CBS domain-containing protein n=1 Tax=Egibacter rhizosphaerae TaxID=1670831 RepID=A0A411YB06_9ACTN|nr:CBS domain-containing protein [Egibacter rhizosphaerae]QBI18375.1 CBS domain-containing protein [Egibacter rhizosphaerae]